MTAEERGLEILELFTDAQYLVTPPRLNRPIRMAGRTLVERRRAEFKAKMAARRQYREVCRANRNDYVPRAMEHTCSCGERYGTAHALATHQRMRGHR
jgi:hypothetical protein